MAKRRAYRKRTRREELSTEMMLLINAAFVAAFAGFGAVFAALALVLTD